jgi:hypothetical protein
MSLYLSSKHAAVDDWYVSTRVDETCPRFVYIETLKNGLGDQLERLFVGLALIYSYPTLNLTMVIEDGFAQKSVHYDHGYSNIMYDVLGLSTDLNRLSAVRQKYHPREVSIGYHNEYGAYMRRERDLAGSFPCNTMQVLDVYDSCQSWCPFFFSGEMQTVLKPLLRKSLRNKSTCFKQHGRFNHVLNHTQLNIVWHIRSGDVCHHCDQGRYYTGIYEFIISSFTNSSLPIPKHQNVVVHQSQFSPNIPTLFADVPFLVPFSPDNLTDVICTFLNADVLIATGSSLPSMIAWFTDEQQPLLFEDVRYDAVAQKARYMHGNVQQDSIHMHDGAIYGNTSADLIRALGPSLQRISHSSTRKLRL